MRKRQITVQKLILTTISDAPTSRRLRIEKTDECIVYSKGLPQFFISNVMYEDIVCRIGREDKKLLLFDDFTCWDEGRLIDKVSAETIKQLHTAN